MPVEQQCPPILPQFMPVVAVAVRGQPEQMEMIPAQSEATVVRALLG
jgi:hypothetical protein